MRPLSANTSVSACQQVPERVTPFYQVLILLAAYFFGSGGGGTSLSERTRDAVDDDVRREAAVAIAEEIEQAAQEHLGQIVRVRDAFFDVARRHDATAWELDAALGLGATEAERLQQVLLDARSRFKDQVNAGEWNEIFRDQD